jgi:hypothetical protein
LGRFRHNSAAELPRRHHAGTLGILTAKLAARICVIALRGHAKVVQLAGLR